MVAFLILNTVVVGACSVEGRRIDERAHVDERRRRSCTAAAAVYHAQRTFVRSNSYIYNGRVHLISNNNNVCSNFHRRQCRCERVAADVDARRAARCRNELVVEQANRCD
jgi:hypothetical protein